jgi:hypothetical protein
MNTNIDIVISYFNENLNWLQYIDYNQINRLHLYTKSNIQLLSLIKNKKVTQYFLPNIGREAHTYLYHIINNYDKLADVVLFVQGSPNFSPSPYRGINKLIQPFCSVPMLSHSNNFKYSNDLYLNENNKILLWNKNKLLDTNFTFTEWFTKFIDKTYPSFPMKIYFEANFGVSKQKILSRDLDYYKRLISQLSENNTEAAHFLERSWYYIFNLDKKKRT